MLKNFNLIFGLVLLLIGLWLLFIKPGIISTIYSVIGIYGILGGMEK